MGFVNPFATGIILHLLKEHRRPVTVFVRCNPGTLDENLSVNFLNVLITASMKMEEMLLCKFVFL